MVNSKKIINLSLNSFYLLRPLHWVKNLSLFAALIFSGNLYQPLLFFRVFEAFLVFNIISSSVYVLNDLLDADRDRLHPVKKNRPIASGTVPKKLALIIAILLAIIALIWASQLSYFFFLSVLAYLIIQISYSTYLKNLPVIDILLIASGFVIRVYSGAFVIDAHLSVWFLLCVISAALFLASGKRRVELGILGRQSQTRSSLAKYPKDLLNAYVTMFGNAAWMSWALFTFFESPKVPANLWLFLAELSQTTTINKLLMVTIPVTIFGIMKYESLIFDEVAESPEKLLLTNKSLIFSVVLWTLLVIGILYGGF